MKEGNHMPILSTHNEMRSTIAGNWDAGVQGVYLDRPAKKKDVGVCKGEEKRFVYLDGSPQTHAK